MRKSLVLAMVLACSCTASFAGPFGRSRAVSRSSVCVDGQCGEHLEVRQRTVVRGSGAQAHAEAMAASGRLVHAGDHGSTYEGVGVGGSPESALRSCCNNGGSILEEGVAYGHGRYWACRRYSQR